MIEQLQKFNDLYPLFFQMYLNFINKLDNSKQLILANTFDNLATSNLLDHTVVVMVLEISKNNLQRLVNIINGLNKFELLNEDSFLFIWKLKVECKLNKLADNFKIIKSFDEDDVDKCLDFINTYNHYFERTDVLFNFLARDVNLNGLNDALELFNFSSYEFNEKNLGIIKQLSNILSNPLAQTIYDARLRCFSDYSQPSEPLNNSSVANAIINQLMKPSSFDTKMHKFVDYFIKFKPFPGSQKYLVEVDVNELVPRPLINRSISR